jgi:hypothetical protein
MKVIFRRILLWHHLDKHRPAGEITLLDALVQVALVAFPILTDDGFGLFIGQILDPLLGADMQPQGHVQFLVNLIDFKMNLQEAIDAPRVRHLEGMEVYLENGISGKVASALQAKGHHLFKGDSPVNQVGGGQAIYLDRNQNILLGASDRRKDGCALGY